MPMSTGVLSPREVRILPSIPGPYGRNKVNNYAGPLLRAYVPLFDFCCCCCMLYVREELE